MSEPVTQTIFCVECDRESKGKARGWRAYLLHDLRDDVDRQLVEAVAIYCPSCASREFDDPGA